MKAHEQIEHLVDSKIPYVLAKQVLSRHLCGWIAGHAGPVDHFLIDAELILNEMHEAGIRFHLRQETENSMDGFVSYQVKST